MPSLVNKFNVEDLSIINGVLETANSIFKRFRFVYKSDELYAQLKYCLEEFQKPMLELFQMLTGMVDKCVNDQAALIQIFNGLRIMSRVFFSLNWQTIPEFFEDNIKQWMSQFQKFLTYTNPLLVDADEEDEAGPIETLQAAIIDNLALYADKYEEEFQPFLPEMTQNIWSILTATGQQAKYDTLSATGMKFLTNIVSKKWHEAMFQQDGILKNICEEIVIPNLTLRESDTDLFEDDPVEYIRRDIEGSDSDTRRRAAVDLVKGMCINFQGGVTDIMKEYIGQMLQQYEADPAANWLAKDASITLVLALAVQGSTKAHGATSTSDLVDVMDFLVTQIIPELGNAGPDDMPLLKATSVKFLSTFRQMLEPAHIQELMPGLVKLLEAESYVLHTYVASCVERLLILREKDDQTQLKCGPDFLSSNGLVEPLLTGLFAILGRPDYPENEYVMRAIMRVTNVAGPHIAPLCEVLLEQCTRILEKVCANPSNPSFNHYLFETIAALVKNIITADPSTASKFEEMLFPPFQSVLQMDVGEFTPYVFQIMAMLLELRPAGTGASDGYKAMFPLLLTAGLWEQRGNVPPLARLVHAFLQASGDAVEGADLENLLGVFQKLNASKLNEEHGFDLLCAIFANLTVEKFSPYLGTIFELNMMRISGGKTLKYLKGFITSLSVLIGSHGADVASTAMETVQPGVFMMILDQLWTTHSSEIAQIASESVRKNLGVGTIRLFVDMAPQLLAGDQAQQALFGKIVEASVLFLEGSSVEDTGAADVVAGEEALAVAEAAGTYSAAYSKLHYAGQPPRDYFAGVADAKAQLAQSLSEVSGTTPVGAVLQGTLSEASMGKLGEYIAAAGVQIQ